MVFIIAIATTRKVKISLQLSKTLYFAYVSERKIEGSKKKRTNFAHFAH
jgi:hypothetical protein